MLFAQNYAARSSATLDADALGLNLSTEQGRPPVRLHASIQDGPAYARLMKTLYAVVTSNLLTPKRDRSAYFEWVQGRYLEEVTAAQARQLAQVPGWIARRDELKEGIAEQYKRLRQLEVSAHGGDFYAAQRRYWKWLYSHDLDMWVVLDPVVSVHPDCLIFEAFSRDESSYGRVTVPMDRLDIHDAVDYGATNIDFSPDLAREIGRIRSYRETDLHVGPLAVGLETAAGSVVEKKIDLPPTWVRGFLQVQLAATLPGVDVRLSASTVADVLAVIRRRHEDRGPRSLRFVLTPGAKPVVVVEPWGVAVAEHAHTFDGASRQEIRVWGRRRLLSLEEMLPHADEVRVRLLGTGLPSYWSVLAATSRFDLGLSGWTQNDWSRAAQFDLLASIGRPSADALQSASRALEDRLFSHPRRGGRPGGDRPQRGHGGAAGALPRGPRHVRLRHRRVPLAAAVPGHARARGRHRGPAPGGCAPTRRTPRRHLERAAADDCGRRDTRRHGGSRHGDPSDVAALANLRIQRRQVGQVLEHPADRRFARGAFRPRWDRRSAPAERLHERPRGYHFARQAGQGEDEQGLPRNDTARGCRIVAARRTASIDGRCRAGRGEHAVQCARQGREDVRRHPGRRRGRSRRLRPVYMQRLPARQTAQGSLPTYPGG